MPRLADKTDGSEHFIQLVMRDGTRMPRMEIPSGCHVSARYPPPDPRHNRNPGPCEYSTSYSVGHGYRTTPKWTITPDQYWRHVPHPQTGVFQPGQVTWTGRQTQRLQRPQLMDPLDPRRDEGGPLPPFFRKSFLLSLKERGLDRKNEQVVRPSTSANGSKLTAYRKTMEVVVEAKGRRRSLAPTPQVNSTDEFMTKHHPPLMLPDPALGPYGKLKTSRSVNMPSSIRPCSSQQSFGDFRPLSMQSSRSAKSLHVPVIPYNTIDQKSIDNPLNEG